MVQLSSSPTLPSIPARLSLPARYRDAALFGLLAVLFGGSFVGIKAGLRELPPVLFAALRFDVGAVALLAYVVFSRPRTRWRPQTRADVLGVGVAATFLVAANNAFLFAGQALTTPAAASVMYGLNPVLAPVFAWFVLGQRLSRVNAAGIAVALGGVLLVVQPSPSAFGGGAVGQALVMIAAVSVAAGSVLLRRLDASMDDVALTAWAMAGGAVLLHGASLAAGESPARVADVGATTVASVLAVGLPATAVAYAIYVGLVTRVGPVRTNLVSYAFPAFAAVSGWLVLGAPVSAGTVFGFVVVVAGFVLVEHETLRTELCRVRRRREGCDPTASPFPCDD
ncbi:MAG: permeases of the drug/metabolite transporter (DMT) superfamily [uncultured archaeon A07HB70]|nr:MAG: permeases of the drug/metabolite transporter (DMT) superfamily [uncultured archaeon A07HB70]